jgi:hypothetical protein
MSPQYMCPLLHGAHVSMYLTLKSWTVCLNVWITSAWCTIFNAVCTSGCTEIEMTPITIALRCLTGYKYSFHLAMLAILHYFSFRLGFSSLLLTTMEDKRWNKHSCSPSKEGCSSLSSVSTPLLVPSGSMSPPGSPSEVSSHRRCSPLF